MHRVHRLSVTSLLWVLALLGGCIFSDVIPPDAETRNYDSRITIKDPDNGDIISPLRSTSLRLETRDWPPGLSTLRVMMNDSLWIEKTFENYPYVGEYFVPVDWAEQGSMLTIKAIAEDPRGLVFVDSIQIQLGDELAWAPILEYPSNGHLFLSTAISPVQLEVESYSGSGTYTFSIATDPGFADALERTRNRPDIEINGLTADRYYWRVRVSSSAGLRSPWSETRTFWTQQATTPSPVFQAFARIEKLVPGEHGVYLLGDFGDVDGLMKCDENLNVQWLHRLDGANSGLEVVDCDEMADGRLLVGCRQHSSYGDSRLVGLDAAGALIWATDLDGSSLRAVRATNDGAFFCGYSSSSGYIVKVDSTGAQLWGAGGELSCYQLRTDAGRDHCVMLARVSQGSYNLQELDLDGNTVWSSNLNTAVDDYDSPFVLTSLVSGGYVFGSTVEFDNVDSPFIAVTAPGGDVLRQGYIESALPARRNSYLGDIREGQDGDLYFIGSVRVGTGSYSNYKHDLLLVHLRSDGSLDWARTYGSTSKSEIGTGLAVFTDRIILVGYQDGSASDVAVVLTVDLDGEPLLQ